MFEGKDKQKGEALPDELTKWKQEASNFEVFQVCIIVQGIKQAVTW